MKLDDAAHPLGVLTSENRDKWATIRNDLEKLGNQEALHLIDSSIYCLLVQEASL